MLTGTLAVYTGEAITAVHIHGPAGIHATGPVMLTLPLPTASSVTVNLGPLTPAQEELIRLGNTYIDFHSLDHPDGVIRGQVLPEIATTPIGWSQVKLLYRE